MSTPERSLNPVNLADDWASDSWRGRPALQLPQYPDPGALEAAPKLLPKVLVPPKAGVLAAGAPNAGALAGAPNAGVEAWPKPPPKPEGHGGRVSDCG